MVPSDVTVAGTRSCLSGALLLLAGCTAPEPATPDPFRASGELIALSGGDGGAAHACITCHGIRGEGDGAGTPRLAGLDPGFLHRQLDDYASGRRQNESMRAVALRLSGEDRALVSLYYARLGPEWRATGDGNAAGAHLYQYGDPARGLQPCAVCHGVHGEGVGPANPPLAGQPAAYVAAQLDAWRGGRRHNDPGGDMLAISRSLTPAEIQALAAHIAAFAGPDRREYPAASLPAHHADPRNDVSAPHPHAPGPAAPAG